MSTKIEWTELTWNPTIGCSKTSAGCENCYAIKEAYIRSSNPNEKIRDKFAGTVQKTAGGRLNWTGNINLGNDSLQIPLNRKKPALWFVNSMSDLFHPNMPQDWQDEIHAVMALCRQHTFQVLTKHPQEMLDYYNGGWVLRVAEKLRKVYSPKSKQLFDLCAAAEAELLDLPFGYYLPNLWLGVSVENQKAADERIPILMKVPAEVRFLSCEPLLGSVSIAKWLGDKSQIKNSKYQNIDWVIVGGESGKNARPMHPVWAQGLRNECAEAGVHFFFKQWGEWAPQEHWNDTRVRERCYMWEDGSTSKETFRKDGVGGQIMGLVGKKAAGCLLDFKEYREMPFQSQK